MDAIPLRPRAVAPAVRAVLAWAGVAVLPVLWLYAPTVGYSGGGLGFGELWISERYAVPALVVALPAVLLRRRPLTALGLMLAGAALASGTVNGGDQGYLDDVFRLQFLAVDAALGVVAATRPRRVSLPTAAVVLLVQVGASFLNLGSDPVARATLSVLAVVAAWTVGDSLRTRRRHAEALRSHAAAEAVTAERLRIARELHDMVAHSIGVIAIQAASGPGSSTPSRRRRARRSPSSRRPAGTPWPACGVPSARCAAPTRSRRHWTRRPGWTTSTGWSPPPATRASRWTCGGSAGRWRCRPTSASPPSGSCRRRSPTWSGTRTPTGAG
ncbi:histidine kinase [Micromonospora sp. 4G55]|uniref:histidine kinase n=1 Tax=Micromonospora sp. 4G55 TaxID=2806102 RepID=UPI001A51A6F5|nr:histidine kinase dimerization/phosphoacceptor domain-containing protein [Micromonospora sp. 4G55]MBM0257566.1 histidine kinase dimerization/phosphoacceptor domain-containing protein [Micromonospora sp. 4G55]